LGCRCFDVMFLQRWKGQLPNVSECEPHNVVA
jgi:hypothetical protein